MTRVLVAAFAAIAIASAALAAAPAPLTAATAKWLPDGKVELAVTFDGGACEAAGEALVFAGDTTSLADEVTIPTVTTSDVCTMQVVPVEFTGTIAVEPQTALLTIMVLAPDGTPKAAGTVLIQRSEG